MLAASNMNITVQIRADYYFNALSKNGFGCRPKMKPSIITHLIVFGSHHHGKKLRTYLLPVKYRQIFRIVTKNDIFYILEMF